MLNTVRQYMEGVANGTSRRWLSLIFEALAERYSSCVLQNPGMAISAGGATTAKTNATPLVYIARGIPVSIAASTTLPALTGINFSAGQYIIVAFNADEFGNVTAVGGIPAATLAACKFPTPVPFQAVIGYLIITYASAFTGGTTPLDTATTTYASPDGAFDPTLLTK